jgi:hypothetical protein
MGAGHTADRIGRGGRLRENHFTKRAFAIAGDVSQGSFDCDPVRPSQIRRGPAGTTALIPADAFVFEDGSPVTGSVEIKMTEVTRKQDLLLGHLPTISNGKMLVSGGVVNLEAMSEGKALRMGPGKTVFIQFPRGFEDGMELFSGVPDAQGNMNWEPIKEDQNAKMTIGDVMKTADMAPNGSLSPFYNVKPFMEYGLADWKTFTFEDNKHTVHGYIYKTLEQYYPCFGNDAVYVEVQLDEQGRPFSIKYLTGKNNCFKQAIVEILATVRWKTNERIIRSKTIYFEVKPIIPWSEIKRENVFVSIVDNPKAQLDAETKAAYRAIKETRRVQMEVQRAQSFAREAFATTKLGWINCDRFYNAAQVVDVSVESAQGNFPDNTHAFLVFETMNAVLPGDLLTNGSMGFRKIPPGLKAKIVSISYDKATGGIQLGILPITTTAGNASKLSLQSISEEDLMKAMEAVGSAR